MIGAAPSSRLTLERPDIWRRGLALATGLTGYDYAPKLPLPDGTIYACIGGPARPLSNEEQIKHIDQDIEFWKEVEKGQKPLGVDQATRIIRELEEKKKNLLASNTVFVPEGAMEWLLHEVGHWVAATPEERLLPNYGYGLIKKRGWGKDREWQAWGFEEIILSPFGNPRLFAPPSQRDGIAFEKSGPIPQYASTHAEKRMKSIRIDAEQWRSVWGEWARWSGPDKGVGL